MLPDPRQFGIPLPEVAAAGSGVSTIGSGAGAIPGAKKWEEYSVHATRRDERGAITSLARFQRGRASYAASSRISASTAQERHTAQPGWYCNIRLLHSGQFIAASARSAT